MPPVSNVSCHVNSRCDSLELDDIWVFADNGFDDKPSMMTVYELLGLTGPQMDIPEPVKRCLIDVHGYGTIDIPYTDRV